MKRGGWFLGIDTKIRQELKIGFIECGYRHYLKVKGK
jgi:hypothetical protein